MRVPPSTALVVIDMQCGWFRSSPPPHDSLATIGRISALIQRAHVSSRPVIFMQHTEPPEYTPCTPGWELLPELSRRNEDPLLVKTVCDSFHDTGLDALLRNRGIDTLVVCGAVTEFCIDTTVRRAASLGYRVVVGADSHTTKSQPDMSAAAIIAHHNRVWSEFSAPQPVSVVPSDSIQFG